MDMTSKKQSRSSPFLANNEQRQHHGGGMERRKSSKHNGPPTPWKRKPLLQEHEVDAPPPQQQRQVKRIKLRLSEGPTSRPTSRDGEGSLLKPGQGEGGGPSIPNGEKKEPGFASQPLGATSSNIKIQEGSSSPIVGPAPPIMAASPTILTRIKAQPRNANERAMMQDIETLETMLQLGSYRSSSSSMTIDPQPLPLPDSTSYLPSRERDDGPARSPPPLWARKAEDLSQVTSLCPAPNKSKSKAKLNPVMVKSSRSGIARGLLLTRRPMVGQEVAPKIGREDGRWEFDLVVKGAKGKEKSAVGVGKDEGGVMMAGGVTSGHNAATSSMVKQEAPPLASSGAAPTSIAQLVSQDPCSLALYRAWQHCTSLYLFLSRPCACSSGSECACSEQGGLSMLPCKLPREVGAVAVGWAKVLGAEVVVDEDASAGSGAMKVRWQMQMAMDETSWWLPSMRGKAATSSAWTSTRPPSKQASTRSSTTQSPFHHPNPHSLLTSLPCPLCHLALPRHHWSYYLCPNCGTRIDAYVPSLAAGDVDFGTTSVPTEGPRMDNGRAVWDKGRVGRELRVVEDGEGGGGGVWKGVEYSWSARPGATAVASVPGPSISTPASAPATAAPANSASLIHLLSSASWTRLCKTSLSWLLAPCMPYERRTTELSVFELGVALCQSKSSSKKHKSKGKGKRKGDHGVGPPVELIELDDIGPAHRLVELVEEVEQRVGVAAAAAAAAASRPHRGPRMASRAHLTVLGCDDVKHRLDLPSGTTSGVTYLHLGAPATLSVTTTEGVAGSGHKVKTMMNAMLVNGDVIWVPGKGEAEQKKESTGQVTVAVEAKALCVGLMLVE